MIFFQKTYFYLPQATREKGEFTRIDTLESSPSEKVLVTTIKDYQIAGSEKEGFRVVISQYLND